MIGGRVADLVAVGYGHRHASISMDYKNYYHALFVLLSMQHTDRAIAGLRRAGLFIFLCIYLEGVIG